MEKIVIVNGVLTEKGLKIEVIGEVKVLNQNENALVIDTPDYQTIFLKQKEGEGYGKDFLGKAKIVEFSNKGILEAKGFYKDKQMAKSLLEKTVKEWLNEKSKYYLGLVGKIS